LSELRRARGWTQAQAAERLNVTVRDYQAIEGGHRNVTMRTVVALADAFDVPLRLLIDAPTSHEARRRGRPAIPTGDSVASENPTDSDALAARRPPARRPAPRSK
jgi:transcriptional regulator with XRE-family HTH domain